MSRRTFRTGLAIVVGSLLIAGIIIGLMTRSALRYADQRHAGSGAEIAVEIRPGMAFPAVATELAKRGVIARPTWFRLFAMYRGETTGVKPGKYLLPDNLTPREVLAKLIEGIKDVTVTVTLPEGQHMLEYFAELERSKVAPAAELEALARSREFLSAHGISGDVADGYLFPDTYKFRIGEEPKKVLERLISRHQQVWRDVTTAHASALARLKAKLGWSDRDVLILASIVEKEAVDANEQARISQVFINRLTAPGFPSRQLETDPTIRYGCMVPMQKSPACLAWDKGGRLRRAQLDDTANPYNTYRHKGLPPGPISNPGKGALAAAMEPDGSKFFYFVAVAEGSKTHAFSKTYEEHKAAVAKYVRSQDP